jgi:dynein heavy chain
MRTVTSILLAAKNNRNNMKDQTEDIMCMKALYDVNIPKFLANDIPLFKDITRDLFPGQELPDFKKIEFEEQIYAACEKFDLVCSNKFMEKCYQLLDTNTVRHGYMIVGDTCVGKTECLKVVQTALTSLNQSGNPEYKAEYKTTKTL